MKTLDDLKLPSIILLILMVVSVTLLLIVFRITPEEKEDAWVLYSKDWSTVYSQQSFEAIVNMSAAEKERVNKYEELGASLDYGPAPEELKLSKIRFSEHEIKLNNLIFNIVKTNIHAAPLNLPEELKDPLFVMAQANAEYGGLRGNKGKLLSPAIPASYLDIEDITEEMIKTWNTAKTLTQIEELRDKVLKSGPTGYLQMTADYGSNAPTQLLVYQVTEYEVVGADDSAMRIVPLLKNKAPVNVIVYKGDRWNWNDAVVRSYTKWSSDYSSMIKDETKLAIASKNKYSMMAYLSLTHNVGESISTAPLSSRSDGFIKGVTGDGAKIQDAWNFIEWVSSDSLIREIKNLAIQNIQNNKLQYRPSSADMVRFRDKHKSLMNPETAAILDGNQSTNWTTEPQLHALVVLYNYILIEELAGGM